MDTFPLSIGIKNLKVTCIIGILPKERKIRQEIILDVEVTKMMPALFPDSLSSSIDYRFLAEMCRDMAKKEYHLLESFASELAEAILTATSALSVRLKVGKKKALSSAAYAYVIVERSRA